MSYNGYDMAAAAEVHYREAARELEKIDNGGCTTWVSEKQAIQKASSKALAGLLAMELVKWSVNPDAVE